MTQAELEMAREVALTGHAAIGRVSVRALVAQHADRLVSKAQRLVWRPQIGLLPDSLLFRQR